MSTPNGRDPRSRICPHCRRELPAADLAEPRAPAGEVADGDWEEELDALFELILDALFAHGLGEEFSGWEGEVRIGPLEHRPAGGRGRPEGPVSGEIVLTGTFGLAGGGSRPGRNGTPVSRDRFPVRSGLAVEPSTEAEGDD